MPVEKPEKSRPRLYLIDGYALIYRAYFALIRNPLRTSSGEETSASFGMANFLVKLLDERKPDYLGVVMDSREPTFRHERYSDYKATREKMPDDLSAQLPRVHELFEAFRVPVIEIMMATPLVRKYILDGEFDKLKATVGNREAGSQSFDQHLTEMFQKQIIDVTEAKRLASNVDALNLALRGITNSDTRLR